ncbi:hypothetical protein M0638_28565 [Roseomonas sp. NAR14]|uniref:Secreted protein n=1 Tax=Roseomonas acroporae TaxID=2937791 RepID=A0A9X2C0M7_9PROT|nr:hypothetical protein [Roseomonas acroporae]MCK8788310.1 hypothetical protein [Roseomonas acroporae]
MSAILPRRHALRGAALATLAAGASVPAAATATGNDTLLLTLLADQRVAWDRHEAACAAWGDAEDTPDEPVAEEERSASLAAWEAVMARIAEIPADGLAGLCVKAMLIARALDEGGSLADWRVGESLRADIARLAPAVTV